MNIQQLKSKFFQLRRTQKICIIVSCLIFLLFLVWFGKWCVYRATHATTNAAFVKADLVNLSSLVSGHVDKIFVDEGDAVKEGDVLALLDDRDYKQLLEKAQASFEQAVFNYERYKKLYESKLIPNIQFKGYEVAYKAAKADLEMAKLNLEHTNVIAPFDGIITKRYVQPGDFVGPALPVFSIYDPNTIHVIANLEEGKVKRVVVGQPVDIWTDAHPHVKIEGTVDRVGQATSAEFALIPRDVSAGEFTKVVQRIPVKIIIPNLQKYPFLKPGLSAEVGIAKK